MNTQRNEERSIERYPYVIQYQTLSGMWVTINSCGVFPDRYSAEEYMNDRCAGVVEKRVVQM